MKKNVWYSISLIIIVATSATIGTYAYFTAERTTSASKFVAGTMDLDVSSNGNRLEPFVIENIGNSSTISGSKTWTIKNTGSLPGRLLVSLQNLSNLENGCNDQEKKADPTCEDPSKKGNLGDVIVLKMSVDNKEMASSTLSSASSDRLKSEWEGLDPIILQAGEEKQITAYWEADGSSYGNEIQSDSVQFDVNFRLVQTVNNSSQNN